MHSPQKHHTRYRHSIAAALIGLLCLFGLPLSGSAQSGLTGTAPCAHSTDTTIQAGHCAPAFALRDTQGHIKTLDAYRGHPILLNFWGVGCTYCRQELPDLKRFAARFLKQRGVILGVNTWGEPAGLIAQYDTTNHIAWPLLPNPSGTIGNLYGVTGTPVNVFIGRRGLIRHVTYGPLTYAQFVANMRGL